MTPENKSAATAAFLIMLVFGLGWYFMPAIMIGIGNYSTAAAGLFAVAFVAAFFMIFWLRGKRQRGE